jgi:hypothetical protein
VWLAVRVPLELARPRGCRGRRSKGRSVCWSWSVGRSSWRRCQRGRRCSW